MDLEKIINIVAGGAIDKLKKKIKLYGGIAVGSIAGVILVFCSIFGGGAIDQAQAYYGGDDTNYSGCSGDDQFIEYLHIFEDSQLQTYSINGRECYIVKSDGSASGMAVGYGVDIAAHKTEFAKLGYSNIKIGDYIPVDIVDTMEKNEFQNIKNIVDSRYPNLKQYQKYALMSRMYNCRTELFNCL